MSAPTEGRPDPQNPPRGPAPKRTVLAPGQLDDVASAIMLLGRELWVLTDRMRMLEALLDQHDIPVREQLERSVPDGDLAVELSRDAEAFAARLLNTLAGRGASETETSS
ncbi:MAG: hypothetical protein JJU27_04245 [Gammaproteobacteria bacterium]|nr:hypothetical protein [Gammaproteobacteria bacterium]